MKRPPAWSRTVDRMIADLTTIAAGAQPPLAAECQYRAELLRGLRDAVIATKDVIAAKKSRGVASMVGDRTEAVTHHEEVEEAKTRQRVALEKIDRLAGRKG